MDEKTKNELSAAARAAQRAYNREYYAKNRERLKRRKAEYWERKAREMAGNEAR